MIGKSIFQNKMRLFFVIIFIFLAPIIVSSDNNKSENCIDKAIERIKIIRSLPVMQDLHTLDGQNVLLKEFQVKCNLLFPKCCLFNKFYYWENEIREIVSITSYGLVKHKIRCYYNCLSTFCKDSCDPKKTHGDIAEFYDGNGNFMGLAVYMGGGKYCSLPYDGYQSLN